MNDLFGEGVSGAQQTAFGAARLFGSAMLGQAAFWRDNTGEQDLAGMTPGSLKDGPADSGISSQGYRPRTWRAWATGFGGFATERGSAANGSADLDGHTAGFAAGIDVQIDRTTLVGIAGGYTQSGFSVDQRFTNGTTEGGHVGLYGVKRLGPFYLAGTAEYAHFYNTTDRFIDFVVDERAFGKFTSDAFSARLEAGWRRDFAGHYVTPFAGIELSRLLTGGFAENSINVLGGPGILGLSFDSQSTTSLASSLGLQFDSRYVFSNGHTLLPFVRVAWVHEFDPDRGLTSNLIASPAASFSLDGAPASSDVARVNAGLKLEVTKRAALFGYFTGDFSDRSQSYGGTGGVKITW
jgi:outer membrane autotransporter protein